MTASMAMATSRRLQNRIIWISSMLRLSLLFMVSLSLLNLTMLTLSCTLLKDLADRFLVHSTSVSLLISLVLSGSRCQARDRTSRAHHNRMHPRSQQTHIFPSLGSPQPTRHSGLPQIAWQCCQKRLHGWNRCLLLSMTLDNIMQTKPDTEVQKLSSSSPVHCELT